MDKKTTKKVPSSPKLRRGILAYIDFLGTKNIISSSDEADTKMLTDILEIYNRALSELETKPNISMFKLQTKIFSDNIVICADISNLSDDAVVYASGNLLAFVGFFQAIALEKGYTTRGGLSIGSYFLNDVLIWGNALVQAVVIEEDKAIYPRVVLSEDLVTELSRIEAITGIQLSSVKKDSLDGLSFVDYSWYFADKEGSLKYIITTLSEKLCGSTERIKEKIQWQLNYLQS